MSYLPGSPSHYRNHWGPHNIIVILDVHQSEDPDQTPSDSRTVMRKISRFHGSQVWITRTWMTWSAIVMGIWTCPGITTAAWTWRSLSSTTPRPSCRMWVCRCGGAASSWLTTSSTTTKTSANKQYLKLAPAPDWHPSLLHFVERSRFLVSRISVLFMLCCF